VPLGLAIRPLEVLVFMKILKTKTSTVVHLDSCTPFFPFQPAFLSCSKISMAHLIGGEKKCRVLLSIEDKWDMVPLHFSVMEDEIVPLRLCQSKNESKNLAIFYPS
jgi:hypothetical protein